MLSCLRFLFRQILKKLCEGHELTCFNRSLSIEFFPEFHLEADIKQILHQRLQSFDSVDFGDLQVISYSAILISFTYAEMLF